MEPWTDMKFFLQLSFKDIPLVLVSTTNKQKQKKEKKAATCLHFSFKLSNLG